MNYIITRQKISELIIEGSVRRYNNLGVEHAQRAAKWWVGRFVATIINGG
jgi:hypothetical protein